LIVPDDSGVVNGGGEVLVDGTGRHRRPWREKRLAAEQVAAAYDAIGKPRKAARCRDCGTVLVFDECPVDAQKKLKHANFCRQRLCPMCAWRRSLKWSAEVSRVLHAAAAEHPEWGYVMLTLTQRNVSGNQLATEIGRIFRAWNRLTQRKEFGAAAGWLRVLEVTHSDRDHTGEWHPHIHALLAVTPEYFRGRGYVSHARWVALWRAVLRLGYDPSVEVHRVKARRNGDALDAAAREVGKYTVKDSDLLGDGTNTRERIDVLDRVLKGRRLIAWGGALREIARRIAPAMPEAEEDLIHIAGEDHGPACPVCGTEMRERVYRWVQAVQQYVG